MKLETFFEKFDQFADAPNAVEKMRELVLSLAMQGKLVPQDPNDEPAVVRSDEPIEDVPHDVPTNWRWVCLAELAQFINGDRSKNYPSKSYRVADGVPFINAGHLSNGDVSLADMDYITEEHFDRLGGGKVQRGDVLYCLRGSLGKSAIVSSITRGSIASSLLIVRPRKMILASFLHAYLISPLGGLMIAKYDNGSAQPNLSAANVKKYLFPLPPLLEQRRIVAKLDELMVLCDRLEAQQQERETRHAALARASLARFGDAPTSANLNFLFHDSYSVDRADLRKTILTLAVQGKLVPQDPNEEPGEELLTLIERDRAALANEQGVRPPKNVPPLTADNYPHDIPESWVWSRIGHLALLIDYGTSQKADSDSSKVPVYRMGNIVSGRLVDENLKYVDAGISDLPGLYLKTEDILFNRTNSYELVGKAGIYTGPDNTTTFASYLIRIRLPNTFLFPAFYNVAMNAPYYRQTQIEPEVVQQCGQANFNGTKLASTVVPLPPLAEQRRIVAKVDELMALVDELETQLAASRATAEKLMEAVVAELTTQD